MFEKIMVARELLPLREAAGRGDINAMFRLADCIVKGRGAARSSAAAWRVLHEIFEHPEFTKDLQRFCNTYAMMTHYFQLQYEEGRIDRRRYIVDGGEYLRQLISVMTFAPPSQWNLGQLSRCLDWLIAWEAELQEAETP